MEPAILFVTPFGTISSARRQQRSLRTLPAREMYN
jgi:hypothetical protein